MGLESCSTLGDWLMKSSIEHERAGTGCFAMKQFARRMVVRYDSGALMDANLYRNKVLLGIMETE